eukprot:5842558-Pyramimonas_sp.AAC.1
MNTTSPHPRATPVSDPTALVAEYTVCLRSRKRRAAVSRNPHSGRKRIAIRETPYTTDSVTTDVRRSRAKRSGSNRNLDRHSGNLDRYSGNLDRYSGNLDRYSGYLDSYSGYLDSYSGYLDSYSGYLDRYSGYLDRYSGYLESVQARIEIWIVLRSLRSIGSATDVTLQRLGRRRLESAASTGSWMCTT